MNVRIINIPDISPIDDDFTKMNIGENVKWAGFSGLPRNRLEEGIRGVKLSRYRGAFEAAREAGAADVVVSHLPAMSAATAIALSLLNKDVRHLAFAFNFTKLPTGARSAYMKKAFSRVGRFAVFSQYEKLVYSEYFRIDPSRLVPVIWTQEPPPVLDEHRLAHSGPYFCAIGGEGRDIELIIEAAKRVSLNVRFVIITRPHLMPTIEVPENVSFLTNTPLAITWSIAKQSVAVLVPLKSAETCCGHITIVSAKLLGIPIVTTDSVATIEYISGRDWILSCPPKDSTSFTLLLEKALDEEGRLRALAADAISDESELHSRRHWQNYLRDFIGR